MEYNFTDQALQALAIAREEAIRLHHDYLGAEHILLGLIRFNEGGAVAILHNLSVESAQVQEQVENSLRRGKRKLPVRELPYREVPYSSRAKKVLDLAWEETRDLNRNRVDSEHLLLGLIRENDGIAAAVLFRLGITLEAARREAIKLTQDHAAQQDRSAKSVETAPPPSSPPAQLAPVPPDDAPVAETQASAPAPGTFRSIPELIETAQQQLEAVRTKTSDVWLAFLDCEDAAESGALEKQIQVLQAAEKTWTEKLEMALRVAAVEAQLQSVRAQKTQAAQARQYDQALVLRDREKVLRELLDLSSGLVRRRFRLDEMLAEVMEEKDPANEGTNPEREPVLRDRERRILEALKADADTWEMLRHLPSFPDPEAAPPSAGAEAPAPAPAPAPSSVPAETAPGKSGVTASIFISYHRADDMGHVTGRIYDRLVGEFGRNVVFKDVDSIPLGVDFKQHLDEAVGQCAVFLAVVSTSWQQRLQNPRDFVRIELEAALRRSIPIIPLFVQNTSMPAEDELPPSLQPLVYRNGAPIRPDPDFYNDMSRLVRAIRALLDAR